VKREIRIIFSSKDQITILPQGNHQGSCKAFEQWMNVSNFISSCLHPSSLNFIHHTTSIFDLSTFLIKLPYRTNLVKSCLWGVKRNWDHVFLKNLDSTSTTRKKQPMKLQGLRIYEIWTMDECISFFHFSAFVLSFLFIV